MFLFDLTAVKALLILLSVLHLGQGFSHLHSQISSKTALNAQALSGGSYVALVTPMRPSGQVDIGALNGLLEWHLSAGTDGIVVLGTTGEASTITATERREIVSATVSAVGGAVPVVVGVGAVEAAVVSDMARCAAQCGADAVLVITPYYVKPPQRALIQHYLTVADESPLPVILYNCPGRSGVDLSAVSVAAAARHSNIVGCKDATGDLRRVAQHRELCGDSFLLYRYAPARCANFRK